MIQKVLNVAIVAMLTLAVTATAHDFTHCPGVTDELGIAAVSLSPDPVHPSCNVVVKVSGGPTEIAVSGGNATLSLILFGSTVYRKGYDICTEFGVSCPVPAGEKWSGQIQQAIPKEIPTFGSIKAQVDIYNQTHILSCFTMTIALGPSGCPSLRGATNMDVQKV